MKTVNLGDELIMRGVSQCIAQRIAYGKGSLAAGPPGEEQISATQSASWERESDGHRTRG
jgi:hypothetical protein